VPHGEEAEPDEMVGEEVEKLFEGLGGGGARSLIPGYQE
jgi:hypothetical protein